MRWFVLFPLGFALMFRWGVPVIGGSLANRFGFNLADYHVLIVSLVVMIAPSIAGTIIGFLLLDQRDDQTLAALQVTPLTASGFLAYRLALPTALSIPLTMLALPMTGLVQLGFLELLVVSSPPPLSRRASLCFWPASPTTRSRASR
jgi:fluoroquinolone transport system permease protein